MRKILLEGIASGAVETTQDIRLYVGKTLLMTQEPEAVTRKAHDALRFLCEKAFIVWSKKRRK